MEREQFLRLWVGTCRLDEIEPHPTMVVEADPDRLDEFRKQVLSYCMAPYVTFRQAVLAFDTKEDVKWFHYNDSRLDGIVSLDRWQSIYPNVELLSYDVYRSQSLSDILEDWPAWNSDVAAIKVCISQGNPLQILNGIGSKIHQLTEIALNGIRSAELWKDDCESWLKEKGFRIKAYEPLCWERDPLAFEVIRHMKSEELLRKKYEDEFAKIHGRLNKLLAALHQVFPFDYYRMAHTDLADLSDDDLVEHFISQDGVRPIQLPYCELEAELEKLRHECASKAKFIEFVDEKNSQTTYQLELLKDLVARMLTRS